MIGILGRSARRGLLADRNPSAPDAVHRWRCEHSADIDHGGRTSDSFMRRAGGRRLGGFGGKRPDQPLSAALRRLSFVPSVVVAEVPRESVVRRTSRDMIPCRRRSSG
jgi:hypothetical protein